MKIYSFKTVICFCEDLMLLDVYVKEATSGSSVTHEDQFAFLQL